MLDSFGLNEDEEFIINNLKTMVHLMYNCDYLKAVKTTRFYARVILRIVKQGKSIVEAIEEVAALPENQEDPENKGSIKFSYDFVRNIWTKQCKNHNMSMWFGNPKSTHIDRVHEPSCIRCNNVYMFEVQKHGRGASGKCHVERGLQQPCHRHWCHFRRGRGSAGEIYK